MKSKIICSLQNVKEWLDVVIVGRNNLREKLNYLKIIFFANFNKTSVLICRVSDRIVKNGCPNVLTKRVDDTIRILEEKDTCNMMTNLPLVLNEKYFIIHNFATIYGIVNGSEVSLHAIISFDFQIMIKPFDDQSDIILDDMLICLLWKKLFSLKKDILLKI